MSGLSGSGLVLQNNDTDDLTISGNGAFTFATELETDQDYSVEVKTQPSNPTQACSVANGSGKVGNDDVSVTVIFAPPGGQRRAVSVPSADVTIDAPGPAGTPSAGG